MNRLLFIVVIACLMVACNDSANDVKPSADSTATSSSGGLNEGSTHDTGTIIYKDSGYRVTKPAPADTGHNE